MDGDGRAHYNGRMNRRGYFGNAALLLASGAAGLVYEVLWMKQLGLLFGNTSYAAATTLSAFFLGLAAGGWLWGRRAARMRNPLRGYAWLEVAVAVTAGLYFGLLPVYHAVYPHLFRAIGTSSGLAIAVKFGLSLLVVFPPAFFMGGTIPLMGQHLIRDARLFGATGALLYGVNTLGAAVGAYLAGFHLPLWFGYRGTCGAAMGVTLAVAAAAWWLSRGQGAVAGDGPARTHPREREHGVQRNTPDLPPQLILAVCFLSGFGMLGLEVLWTRMFAQVLENSVYTFAAVLVTILLCLAVGAGIAGALAWMPIRPGGTLVALLVAGAGAAGAAPFVFMHLTDGMRTVGASTGWAGHILDVFRATFLVLGPPGCLLGTIFPYLLKMSESRVTSPGRTLGNLSAINTLGGIAGSVVAGFVVLDRLGLWPGLRAYALLYLLPALALPVAARRVGPVWRAGMIVVVAGAVTLSLWRLNPSGLDRVVVDASGDGEQLVAVFEGSGGTVAVTRTPAEHLPVEHYPLSIKLNNNYPLGSDLAAESQQAQTAIPLLIRPATASVYFLGMGTGITADAALAPMFAVRRTVTCEMSPEVVAAVRKHFRGNLHALLDDPRSQIVIDDARHHLACTPETFDLINGDLFNPYRSGAGSLYTVEHFRTVKRRLAPHGLFVQWLPLFQLTGEEFGIIVRSMLEVFGQVTLWRNTLAPGGEVVGLVGHPDAEPLPIVAEEGDGTDWSALVAGKSVDQSQWLELPLLDPRFVLLLYCGNMTAIAERFDRYPLNTDDHPLIEYMAPLLQQRERTGQASAFVRGELVTFLDELQRACPPGGDPMLANRSATDRLLPRAGLNLHKARLYYQGGRRAEAARSWDAFVSDWLAQGRPVSPGRP